MISRLVLSIFAFLCVLQPLHVSAFGPNGPIIVGGGAGASEFSLLFARANLHQILADCLSFACRLTNEQRAEFEPLLKKSEDLPETIFKRDDELKGSLFEVRDDGRSVWFNQDRLWLDIDRTVPYGASDAAGLWIEILSLLQNRPYKNLPFLKERLAESLQIDRQGHPYDDKSSFELLLWKQGDKHDRLFLSDASGRMLEVTSSILGQLTCSSPESLELFSLAWVSAQPRADGSGDVVFTLSFAARWKCGEKNKNGSGLLAITARPNTNTVLELDSKSLEVEVGAL